MPEYSSLTMFSSFQVYNKVIQLYIYVCVYSFSNSFLIQVVTKCSAELPLLYSNLQYHLKWGMMERGDGVKSY